MNVRMDEGADAAEPGSGEKPGSRRLARKKLFELCFEAHFYDFGDPAAFISQRIDNPIDIDSTDPDFIVTAEFLDENLEFVKLLGEAAIRASKRLDVILEGYPFEWSFDRIGLPEKIVLRIALAELLFFDTPVKIAINEALDLAKAYGEAEANKFVNGILGSIVRDLEKIKLEFFGRSE